MTPSCTVPLLRGLAHRSASLILFSLVALVSFGAPEADKPLKIATHEAPPFVVQTESGAWQGIVIDLWNEIARDLDLDFEFVDVGVSDAVQGLVDERFDGAAMAMTATAKREEVIDFSHPYGTAGLAMAMTLEEESGWLSILRGVFSVRFMSAILALFSVLLVAGVGVWLFERHRNPDQFGGRSIQGLGNSFWWSAVTMTTVGYGDLAPRTLGGRLVALVWMFTSVIIISGFTASIASSITTSNLVSAVRKTQDLTKFQVGTIVGTSSAAYLESVGARARHYEELERVLDALVQGEIEVAVYDEPILKYLAHTDYNGLIEVLPRILQREDYAFAFPVDSELREHVNLKLLDRINNGRVHEIVRRYIGPEG